MGGDSSAKKMLILLNANEISNMYFGREHLMRKNAELKSLFYKN
jgi:hypothetical protein